MSKIKKKVGILTLYFNYNYGAILQATALQKKINALGYDAEEIKYYREINGQSTLSPYKMSNVQKIKKIFSFNFYKNRLRDVMEVLNNTKVDIEKRHKLFDKFLADEIRESTEIYDGHKNIEDSINSYDIFVCGSDNIWNKNMLDTSFMLDFVPNEKLKIAYAPGMSTDSLESHQIEIIEPCVKGIHYISCREFNGSKVLSEMLNKEVPVVLDPTLLLNESQWTGFANSIEGVELPDSYIFCYFCGEEKFARKKALELKKITDMPIITIPNVSGRFTFADYRFGDYNKFNIGPREFLYLIKNAKYICTDSFHGTVFSVIFQKEFFCFQRFFSKKNVFLNFRINNLFTELDIPVERLIVPESNLEDVYKNRLDYKKINCNLERWKRISLEYLQNALSDVDKKI